MTRWLEGDRYDDAPATEAWATAVGLPLEVVRRDSFLPVLGVAMPGSIVAVAIFGLNPLSFLPIFAVGLFLAYLYRHTGSILPGMLAHAFNNAVAFSFLYFAAP